MGRKSKIEVGQWFGMWRVENIADIEQSGPHRKALCRCGKCGYQRLVFVDNLLSGASTRCMYCRGKRGPDQSRYDHPRSRNIKVGTVIGSLTVIEIMQDTLKQRERRTVKARCLCGNEIVRRVEVIRRDEFPTCHHCQEFGTIYRWPLQKHEEIPSAETMDLCCESHEYRWFDMIPATPVEHRTPGYARYLKQNTKGDTDGRV